MREAASLTHALNTQRNSIQIIVSKNKDATHQIFNINRVKIHTL